MGRGEEEWEEKGEEEEGQERRGCRATKQWSTKVSLTANTQTLHYVRGTKPRASHHQSPLPAGRERDGGKGGGERE